MSLEAPRTHSALGRLGLALVRRRGLVLAPLFALGAGLARPVSRELALEASAFAVALAAWALRVWAMGYRNWVRGTGARHLMTRGPYAWVRHPRYLANFLAGLAWFALVADPWLFVAYATIYWAILGAVIVREEEKLAQDYPGFAEFRARVPALVPRPWRRSREPSPVAESERWQAATVLRGQELAKLALVLAALAGLVGARRSGEAFVVRERVLAAVGLASKG